MITKEDIEAFEKRMDKYSATCGKCSDFSDAISLAISELEEMAEA